MTAIVTPMTSSSLTPVGVPSHPILQPNKLPFLSQDDGVRYLLQTIHDERKQED